MTEGKKLSMEDVWNLNCTALNVLVIDIVVDF